MAKTGVILKGISCSDSLFNILTNSCINLEKMGRMLGS